MDEIFALLAEQVTKKVRAAQQSAAQAAAQSESPVRAPQRAPRALPGPPLSAVQPSVAAQPADASLSRRLRRDMPAERDVPPPAFGVALTPPALPPVPSALLAAFRGGPPLLAAIVLAEALAPPLALQPFDARKR